MGIVPHQILDAQPKEEANDILNIGAGESAEGSKLDWRKKDFYLRCILKIILDFRGTENRSSTPADLLRLYTDPGLLDQGSMKLSRSINIEELHRDKKMLPSLLWPSTKARLSLWSQGNQELPGADPTSTDFYSRLDVGLFTSLSPGKEATFPIAKSA